MPYFKYVAYAWVPWWTGALDTKVMGDILENPMADAMHMTISGVIESFACIRTVEYGTEYNG